MLPESRFRSEELACGLLKEIARLATKLEDPINIMEVCGTHTMSIARYGIRALLPEKVRLLSGPGCPVCVTDEGYIDAAVELARTGDFRIATFGDMLRVPGSDGSSLEEHSDTVSVCYSVTDALNMAREATKPVIFLAVGFETTAPTVAAAILKAERENIKNFFILAAHKLIPPAMDALLATGKARIDAFICPGHVSTIIGADAYRGIVEKYRTPCVVTGFEPLDVLQSVSMILRQRIDDRPEVAIQYRRVVRREGNTKALETMFAVFDVADASWRGIGLIPGSGLRLKEKFRKFDAAEEFGITVEQKGKSDKRCICGLIMQGLRLPPDCRLFAKECTPLRPVGPCMVSTEGSCAAFYKYERKTHPK